MKFRGEIFGPVAPEVADISIRVYNPSDSATGGMVVCTVETDSATISYQSAGLDPAQAIPGRWYEIKRQFRLPVMNNWMDRVTVYVWNPRKTSFYVDDLKTVFR